MFTVVGARFGCRHRTMVPFDVTIVAWYSLAVLIVVAGAALYVCTLAGGCRGVSTGPKVVVAQSAKGMLGAAEGDGLAVGVGTTAVGVALGIGGSGELAPLTPTAIATIAVTRPAPDPSTSGRRLRPPDESLIHSLLGFREPARGGTRVVRDDHVGTRAADAAECFEDRGALVERSRGRCVMEHCEFAAHAVRGEGQIGGVADPGDDVEVGERGLDHDHVRALLDVEDGFAHGLALVRGVHLVRAPVPRPRGRVGSIAEGAVEHGREFRAVGEDRGIGEPGDVERLADRGDLSIHHPARRDDVRACRRLAHRSPRVKLESCVVVDVTVLQREAAVPVVGVFTEAAIRDHHARVTKTLAQGTDRLLDHPVVSERARSLRVLGVRQPEEQYPAEAETDRLLDGGAQGVDALVTVAPI